MTKRAAIPAWLLRPPVWLIACAVLLAAFILILLVEQQDWRRRAAALQRENLGLQLTQLAHELSTVPEHLSDRTRELAESDAIARLVQENGDISADRVELGDAARHGIDGLLILSPARTVRFSAVMVGGQLKDQPADPAVLRFAGAAASAAGSAEGAIRPAQPPGFADGRWMVARAVTARNSPAAILGWVVATRALTPALIEQLERPLHGSLQLIPVQQFATEYPAQMPGPDAMHIVKPISVNTVQSLDDAYGYAAVRDAAGAPVRVLRLTPTAAATAAAVAPHGDTLSSALIALLAVLLLVILVLSGYFRHQRSVDARYKALIDQANDGIVIVDAISYRVLYANPAFLARLGYTHDEARALTLADVFADGDTPADSVMARLRDADPQLAMNIQQRCKSGALIDTEVRCNALDVDGRDVLACVTHDVSLRRKAEQQLIENQQRLDRMAHHDQLTGLPNRHYLTAFLPQAIEEAKAANSMLGVVFLDLDRFKHINDTRGHETGDKLLQEVSTRLKACVRDTDVVIRMGGEEFLVVFRHVKSYDEVTLGAGRIIETLNRPIVIDRHTLQTTGSVGVSLYPRDGADMVELLKHSDTAMYQAKDRGRNNVQMFSHAMNRKLKHRVAVEASLREALRLKQLDVHFQPFVNLVTRKIVGLEALMRWSHPVHGMIPADQFIPVAEETGLIVPMGNFVLHRALQTMSAWRKAGVPLVPVSLNIAPAQLQRGELQSTISTLLQTHGIAPDMLQLEMTERAMFDSRAAGGDNRQDTMARLRDLGVKIAIDDFGTG
jgi:diguanylate cyclase (GGDEF)-like protein/PAS domain S-box-containing protein